MTATEWLLDWMGKNQYFIGNDLVEAFSKAKEMEKQQIKDAYKFGLEDEYVIGSEQYYEQYKLLLETYMCGFNDELHGETKIWNPNPLLLRAYNFGRQDAIIGDDVRSVDYKTNEEIFNKIRNQNIC